MNELIMRDFRQEDAEKINAIALSAFTQYENDYEDWSAFSEGIARMSDLSSEAEIIIAERNDQIVGAVAYVRPEGKRQAFFPPEWALIRMLVVPPASRGQGTGRALTDECIRRAYRDGASAIGLHTSPIMKVALALYLRLGFIKDADLSPIRGVPYGRYVLPLEAHVVNGHELF